MYHPTDNTAESSTATPGRAPEPLRLLLLEDSPLDAELALAHLTDGGLELVEAVRVDTEADFTRELARDPDLILADYSLPSFDGITALELTRAYRPDIPFLFVTGALGEELAIDTLKRGATDYVLKDRLERLTPAVQRALRERDERRERTRLEAALRTSEQRYRSLVEAISQVVWTTDEAGNVTQDMPGWRQVTGKEAETTLGLRWLDDLHPDDRERVRASWLDACRTRTLYATEYRLLASDGTYRHFASRGVPVLDRDGGVREWVGLCTDVTDQKRNEEQLRRQAEALAAADAEKNRFLAILGHELRNPLAPILSATAILQENSSPEVVRRQRLVIERQIRHMARLIDDLLDVARITRGTIELRLERVDLRSLLEQAVQMAAPLIESRAHQLEVRLEEAPLCLFADPARLTQVIGNLLNNAAKYTPPGGRIELRVERAADQVCIRVKDTGQGIPTGRLGEVFQLFTRLDHAGEADQQGLGIGLTLVKNLVELHGGTIEAHSEGAGRGSEFTVWLPVTTGVPLAADAGGPEAATPVPVSGKQILVVDDNVDAAETLSELLELWGHHVAVAHDGASALLEAGLHKPELVILDIGLPGMDGYEVARRLRSNPELRHIPLVAVTGYGRPHDREQAEQAGFDHHLTKPVDPEAIRHLLKGPGFAAEDRPTPTA
ncbi:MAG: response regulator [Armatimonadota bacterium]